MTTELDLFSNFHTEITFVYNNLLKNFIPYWQIARNNLALLLFPANNEIEVRDYITYT